MAALWVDVVGQRNNLPSRLTQSSSQIDMTKWPAPIIGLFVGQMTAAAVLAAADDLDAATKKEKVCEANFYTGELSLSKGSKEEAIRLFDFAANDCPRASLQWYASKEELRALGVKVSERRQASTTSQPDLEKPVTHQALGLGLATLSQDLRSRYKIADSAKGLVIMSVDDASDAAEKRLSAGDVIVEVAQQAVSDAADVKRIADQAKSDGKKSILLLISNADGLRFVALRVQ
jgi:hypothetical protein